MIEQQDRSIYKLGGSRARGFAAMSEERRQAIAAKGGKRAHELGRAYCWTSEKAREAGRRGGSISRRRSSGMSREKQATTRRKATQVRH